MHSTNLSFRYSNRHTGMHTLLGFGGMVLGSFRKLGLVGFKHFDDFLQLFDGRFQPGLACDSALLVGIQALGLVLVGLNALLEALHNFNFLFRCKLHEGSVQSS